MRKIRQLLILVVSGISFCLLGAADAGEMPPTVRAYVASVYDGDTFFAELVIGPGFTWKGGVDIRGVDTPEMRGECQAESDMAVWARDFVVGRLVQVANREVTLVHVESNRYEGRVVATVLYEYEGQMHDVGVQLIKAKLGRRYDGEAQRKGWCEAPPGRGQAGTGS